MGRKMVLASIISPTSGDIRQAAGFLEGEGNFHANKNSTTIRASQINKEPLEKLQAWFGGSIIRKTDSYHPNGIWVWAASGARSRGIMMTIYKFMSLRRKAQIRSALGAI